LKKEILFSVVLKIASIFLLFFVLVKYIEMKGISMATYIEPLAEPSVILTPYNVWIVMSWVLVLLALYLWYRANRLVEIENSVDFHLGAYVFLGFYFFILGSLEIHGFIVRCHLEDREQFLSSFPLDLLFNGFGIFFVGVVVLFMNLKRIIQKGRP